LLRGDPGQWAAITPQETKDKMKTEQTGAVVGHTPEKWTVKSNTRESVIRSGDQFVASILGSDNFNHKADARLIAASPNLYEFVRTLADNGNQEAKNTLASLGLSD
jgi:hypothetical protein